MPPNVVWRKGLNVLKKYKRRGTTKACVQAAKQADFEDFETLIIWEVVHSSRSDRRAHVTVVLKTKVQAANGQHMVAHIYHDSRFKYYGHKIHPDVLDDDRKKSAALVPEEQELELVWTEDMYDDKVEDVLS